MLQNSVCLRVIHSLSIDLFQGKIADMYTMLSSSRSYVYAVARACDNGNYDKKDCVGALFYSSASAVTVASEAIQCLGIHIVLLIQNGIYLI